MRLIDRLYEYAEHKGLTINELTNVTGVSNSYYSKQKNSAKGNIGSQLIEKIVMSFDDINTHWLITGQGEMLKSSPNSQDSAKAVKAEPTIENFLTNRQTAIPLVSVTAVGGRWNEDFSISDQDVKEFYVIPKFKYSKVDFLIEVRGDSMSPRYKSGDIVGCSVLRNSSFIQWNRPHIIATEEQGIMIKRLGRGNSPDTFTIIADNPAFPSFEIPRSEITGLGLVVGGVTIE